MTIELSMYCKDTSLDPDELNNLIRAAKNLGGLAISGKDRLLVVGSCAIFHAYGIEEKDMEKIHSDLKPINAEISLNKTKEELRGQEEPRIDISWETQNDRSQIPGRILAAFRINPDYVRCTKCGKWTETGMGGKFCPHCQNPLDAKPWDRKLGCCQECPEDSEGGSVYHHSYEYCPKCSKPLKRIDCHWFDFNCPEEHFLGDGIPLSELDLSGLTETKDDE